MKTTFRWAAAMLVAVILLPGCDSDPLHQEEIAAVSTDNKGLDLAFLNPGSSHAAGVNIPGCNNDEGLTDIIGPDAVPPFSEEDLIFNLPIVSSNCVIGAGPIEHYTVLAELPEEITPPKRPVVWNFENTELPCFASTETFNFTTDWEQRITPSGNVILVCRFKAAD